MHVRKQRKIPQSPRKRREHQRQHKREVRAANHLPSVTVKTPTAAIETAAARFVKKISQGPVYPCSSCNRSMYKHSVVQLSRTTFLASSSSEQSEILSVVHTKYYNKNSKVSHAQHIATMQKVLCPETVKPGPDGKLYICHTCQRALKQSKVPTQAVANSLQLSDIPPELSDLND